MDRVHEMTEANLKTAQSKSHEAVGKLHEFCSETTAHGFGRLASSKSIPERLIWSVCLLSALVYTAYQGFNLVSAFFLYPVDVKVEMKHVEDLEFPAIVVCNMNAVRKTGLKRAIREGLTDPHPKWAQFKQNGSRLLMSSYKYAFIASLDDSVKQSVGHQVDDFILQCIWKGEVCGPENFTLLYNFVYGNCYVFAGENMTQNVSVPGNENGLSLILNIEADEYLGDFSESYGAVIDITSSKVKYFPEENGYLVAPGQITNIGFSQRVVTRLDFPYEGKYCGWPANTPDDLPYHSDRYSQMACRKACTAQHQLRECGCVEIAYQVKPNCDPLNLTQGRCIKVVNDRLRLSNLTCNCNEDCRQYEYPATTSSAIWPTEAYLVLLRHMLGNKASNVTNNHAEARRNLARVDIYYKSMTVEIIAQEQRYKPEDLLSSIGGSLGLFTGISILTLLEFCKLLFDLTRFFCKKKFKNDSTVQAQGMMHDENEKEPRKPDLTAR